MYVHTEKFKFPAHSGGRTEFVEPLLWGTEDALWWCLAWGPGSHRKICCWGWYAPPSLLLWICCLILKLWRKSSLKFCARSSGLPRPSMNLVMPHLALAAGRAANARHTPMALWPGHQFSVEDEPCHPWQPKLCCSSCCCCYCEAMQAIRKSFLSWVILKLSITVGDSDGVDSIFLYVCFALYWNWPPLPLISNIGCNWLKSFDSYLKTFLSWPSLACGGVEKSEGGVCCQCCPLFRLAHWGLT